MRLSLALALALALAPLAAAYPDPQKAPRYFESDCFETYDKRFVHDYVGLFARWGPELEPAACEVYATTSAHVVILAVKDTEGDVLENYAFRLFEAWGIGDKERLDGLLILYVDDYLGEGESALRIEVGYGLEGVINSRVSNEAWDLMVQTRDDAVAAGDTEDDARALAIAAGSLYLMQTLIDSYTEAGFPEPAPEEGPSIWFWVGVLVLIILLLWLLSRSSRGRRGWGYRSGSSAWGGPGGGIWIPPGSFGGGGGFGGGGSFGGGRSGGGGRGGRF